MSDEQERREDNALVLTARQLSAKTALVKRGIGLTELLLSHERAEAELRMLLDEAKTWDGFTENQDEILKLLKEDSKQAAITGKYQHTLESAYRHVVGTEQPSTHRGPVVEINLPDIIDDSDAVLVGPVGDVDAWNDVEPGGEWVLDWLKNEGDKVTAGEPLAELRADGWTIPLPSPVDGVLVEIRAKHGLVELGSVVALVKSSSVRQGDAVSFGKSSSSKQMTAEQAPEIPVLETPQGGTTPVGNAADILELRKGRY